MRHSKRTKLTTDDVDGALNLTNVEVKLRTTDVLDSLFVKHHQIEKALDDDDDVLLSYAEICSYVCLGFNL